MKYLLAFLLFAGVAHAEQWEALYPGGDTEQVFFTLENNTSEVMEYGDYGSDSHEATGPCTDDFFGGFSLYAICEDFTGAAGSLNPGETTNVWVLTLNSRPDAPLGFNWLEDVTIYTNQGSFPYQFHGVIGEIPDSDPRTTVPEPASVVLMLTGLAGVYSKLRRRQ